MSVLGVALGVLAEALKAALDAEVRTGSSNPAISAIFYDAPGTVERRGRISADFALIPGEN